MIPLENNGYVTTAWVGTALLALATAIVTLRGDWLGALLLAAFLVGSIIFVKGKTAGLPSLFDLLFVTAAIVNAAGWVWDLYSRVPGYDEFAHFFTVFAVTLSLGFLVYGSVREPFRDHRSRFVLVIASFGVTIGVLWEIVEWLYMELMTSRNEMKDPVTDLIADSLGALGAGFTAAVAMNVEPFRTLDD